MSTPVSAPLSNGNEGIVFPTDASGRRRTTHIGRAVFADALRIANPEAAAACEQEQHWRQQYVVHALRLVEEAARTPSLVQSIAREGLRSAHQRLQFVRDGASGTIDEAMRAPRAGWRTRTVTGVGKFGPVPIAIPYQGKMLTGDTLRRQIDRWEVDGVIEPTFAQALWRVQAHPEWIDLSDQRFALLGAQAEMAPLLWLLRWRATVYAIDLPCAATWQRLGRLAHAGNGVLHAPCAPDAAAGDFATESGADLIVNAPEIAAWLAQSEGPLTVGAYAYRDGAQHVRVAAAMDAIQTRLATQHDHVTLAMLATPTDAYAVPATALQAAHARFATRGPVARAARFATAGRGFARNGNVLADASGGDVSGVGGVVDALIVQQGPNYVLAKRLQHWRALVARSTGTRVSIHVAPPTLTGSVLKNKLIAAAYQTAHRFGVQTFDPATAAALMAALLVHDLRHADAIANPATTLEHPLQLLNHAACHGGLWRMPFAARSALPIAGALGLLGWR